MAILQRCCCFDNVRTGSTASGIYTLVYSLLCLGYGGWQVWLYIYSGLSTSDAFFIVYCFEMASWGLVFFAAILLLVGISSDRRGYLLPYMVMMPLIILIQAAGIVLYILYLVQPAYSANNITFGLGVAFLILFSLTDLMCFLCVISQYQELRDGRGRLQDVIAARTHTTVITTPAVGGAVMYTPSKQEYPPQPEDPPTYAEKQNP